MYFHIYPVGGGFIRPKTGSMNRTPTSKTPSANNLLTPEFWLLTSSLQDTIHEIRDTCFGHDTSCPYFFQNPQLATQNSLLITHYSSLITVFSIYSILYTIFFPLYTSRSAIPLVRRKSSRLFLK